jgi:hypothetical protein
MPLACQRPMRRRQIKNINADEVKFNPTQTLTMFVRTDSTRPSNISESRRNHSSAVRFHFANLEHATHISGDTL